MTFLFIGAVLEQEFSGADGVGNHHGQSTADGACRDLQDDLGVASLRKTFPAVLWRDDHAEESVLFQVGPGSFRDVVQFVVVPPIIEHGADVLHRPFKKITLGFGQMGDLGIQQFSPPRAAAEQFRIPPGRAGFQRLALGARELRHGGFIESE